MLYKSRLTQWEVSAVKMASFSSLVALTILGCLVFVDVANAKNYKVSNTKVNWFKAYELCRLQGDRLASIFSPTEQKFMEDESIAKKGFGDLDEIWIGLTDLTKEGDQHWFATGQPSSYFNWATGQPDNKNNQDCVSMTKASGYKWSDHNCYDLKYYVCETALLPGTTNPSSN